MAVPAMAAMIATSTARSAAAKNAEKETNKKKTTAKKPAPAKMPAMAKPVAKKAAAKPAPKSGPMRRTTMADRIQDAKNVQPKGPVKPKTTKAKQPVGPAAVKMIQDRTSPAGVKKAEADAKKAIDKKYPGLYKKSK